MQAPIRTHLLGMLVCVCVCVCVHACACICFAHGLVVSWFCCLKLNIVVLYTSLCLCLCQSCVLKASQYNFNT